METPQEIKKEIKCTKTGKVLKFKIRPFDLQKLNLEMTISFIDGLLLHHSFRKDQQGRSINKD